MTLSDINKVNSPSPNPIKVFEYVRYRMQTDSTEQSHIYLKESDLSNPGNFYPVMELETMYSDLLKSDNIHHNNHTTTFTGLLVEYVPGLNKKTVNKHVSVIFDTAAIVLNTSSETYFDSLVKVTGPVRKAMNRKCQEDS